jgi:phage-related protein
MARWAAKQFGSVVDRFRAECPPNVWDEMLIAYGVLLSRGPQAGPSVAKKLKGGDGIWELIAHYDNLQPRLLFYYQPKGVLIVFVHAFIKQGKQDYRAAIKLAKTRRASIERGQKHANDITAFNSRVH